MFCFTDLFDFDIIIFQAFAMYALIPHCLRGPMAGYEQEVSYM